jgi:hypothetical protein
VRSEVGASGLGAAAGPVEGGCLSGRQRAGHVAVGRAAWSRGSSGSGQACNK